jgi:Tfp pilus assembly protein PilF
VPALDARPIMQNSTPNCSNPLEKATPQLDEGEREFQRALQLNPNSSNAHYFLAFVLLLPQNRIDQGLEEMRIALSLDPLSSILNVNYAAMLMAARRYPESLTQFQKALALDPNFPPAHLKVSELYATTGEIC